jgi:hypothetical protein
LKSTSTKFASGTGGDLALGTLMAWLLGVGAHLLRQLLLLA